MGDVQTRVSVSSSYMGLLLLAEAFLGSPGESRAEMQVLAVVSHAAQCRCDPHKHEPYRQGKRHLFDVNSRCLLGVSATVV